MIPETYPVTVKARNREDARSIAREIASWDGYLFIAMKRITNDGPADADGFITYHVELAVARKVQP